MRAIKCFEMYENFVLGCMKGHILQPGTSEAFQSRGHIGTLYIYIRKKTLKCCKKQGNLRKKGNSKKLEFISLVPPSFDVPPCV